MTTEEFITYGQELLTQIPQGPWEKEFHALFRVMKTEGAKQLDVAHAMSLVHHLITSVAVASSSAGHCHECGVTYHVFHEANLPVEHKPGCLITWFCK